MFRLPIPVWASLRRSWTAFSISISTLPRGRMKMGFGLSTDYKIIHDHQGEIRIDSVVGKGTEVTISLPMKRVGSG